jgi:hypothetical protein
MSRPACQRGRCRGRLRAADAGAASQEGKRAVSPEGISRRASGGRRANRCRRARAERPGRTRGGENLLPDCDRVLATVANTWSRPPRRGHASTSIANARGINAAHVQLRGARPRAPVWPGPSETAPIATFSMAPGRGEPPNGPAGDRADGPRAWHPRAGRAPCPTTQSVVTIRISPPACDRGAERLRFAV